MRAVHSVYCACLSWAFVKFCVCPPFPSAIESMTLVVIVIIPEHCLSIYFTLFTSYLLSCLCIV